MTDHEAVQVIHGELDFQINKCIEQADLVADVEPEYAVVKVYLTAALSSLKVLKDRKAFKESQNDQDQ